MVFDFLLLFVLGVLGCQSKEFRQFLCSFFLYIIFLAVKNWFRVSFIILHSIFPTIFKNIFVSNLSILKYSICLLRERDRKRDLVRREIIRELIFQAELQASLAPLRVQPHSEV
jgi:hypothetical protein